MTTIAITGATGFIGGRLVAYFQERGDTILAFGRQAVPPIHLKVPYEAWDITRESRTFGRDIDVVIHCAGSVTDWGSYKDLYAANVTGTQRVMAAFAHARQFIYVSSASVYDPYTSKRDLTETAAYGRRYLNPYGQTKMLAEQAIRASAQRNWVIVRPHIVYGPGDTTLYPRLKQARRAGRFMVIGDGRNRLSLTYVDNLAQAIACIIDSGITGHIFNVSDAEPEAVDRLLPAFLKAVGWPETITYVPKCMALAAACILEPLYHAAHSSHPPLLTRYIVSQMASDYSLNISHARTLLGYAPRFSYREGFAAFSAWLATEAISDTKPG